MICLYPLQCVLSGYISFLPFTELCTRHEVNSVKKISVTLRKCILKNEEAAMHI